MRDILYVGSVVSCNPHSRHAICTSHWTCTSVHSKSSLWSKHLNHVCCDEGIRGGRTPE